jgi:hypothetical protein
MHIRNIKIIVIIILSIVLFWITYNKYLKIEFFQDNLENVDLMDEKMDDLIEKEEETRMFCKLLRANNSPKKQLQTILEHRNKNFKQTIDKQNNTISEIKQKIIKYNLDKNNKEFMDFNTERNRKDMGNKLRQNIINNAKDIIKQGPYINLSVNNNYSK